MTGDDEIALAETTASSDDAETIDEPGAPRAAARGLPIVDRGRYAVEGELARGGLGRILRARDRRLARTVALKEMLGGGADAERRFVREALITARLEHPSIVPVHDAGQGDDGAPFYAMKLVGGRPLTEVIAAATTTPARLALVPRILAVADAIAYAHAERVVHRDLKPANVLVGEFGETIVIDWGLAKDLDAAEVDAPADAPLVAADGATVAGAIVGTPAYMAPEQAAGGEVDERADVYALGAMLYELLSGTPPHRGKTLDEVLRRVIAGDLEPLHRRAPDVPADLAAIVAKAMAREPAERYRTARELADDLRRFVTGQLVAVYDYGWRERLRRWAARNRAPLAVALVAALVLAVLGAVAIDRILRERDQAWAARAVAQDHAREAEAQRAAAERRGDELLIEQARAVVDRDPTRALAILAGLPAGSPRWSAARIVAADALARGAGDVLAGHAAATEAVAVDGDGDVIASIGKDGIRVWDLGARTVRAIALPPPCGDADDCVFGRWSLALSRDGRRLAATAGVVYLYDLAAPAAAPTVVAGDRAWLLDDGKVVVGAGGGDDAHVDLFDPETGARSVLFAGAAEQWIVSPGGVVIAVHPDELRVWRAGEARVAVRAGPVRADAVAVSRSGALIAWAEAEARAGIASAPKDDTTLWVWRRGARGPTGYPIEWPHDLTIGRDDRTILWHDDGDVLWLALEPALDLARWRGGDAGRIDELHAGPARGVAALASDRGIAVVRDGVGAGWHLGLARDWRLALSGDGARLAAAGAPVVRTWAIGAAPVAIATPPWPATPPLPPGERRPPRMLTTPELVASADGTTFVVDWSAHPVEVWRRTGATLARAGTLAIPNDADLSVSPDGATVLFVDDEGAATIPTAGGPVTRLGPAELGWYGPDGAAYTVADATTVERWSGGAATRVCAETAGWDAIRTSPDGGTVATLAAGAVRTCRLATGATASIDGVGALEAWTLRDDGGAVVGWDRAAGELVVAGAGAARRVPLAAPPIRVALSPDGRWAIAVAAEGGVTIVDVAAGAARPVALPGAMAPHVAFAPGDVAIVGAHDGVAAIDLATGVHRPLPLAGAPGAVAAYGDGAIAATAAGELRVWIDDLPHDPAALRAAILGASNARLGASGELVMAAPFREVP